MRSQFDTSNNSFKRKWKWLTIVAVASAPLGIFLYTILLNALITTDQSIYANETSEHLATESIEIVTDPASDLGRAQSDSGEVLIEDTDGSDRNSVDLNAANTKSETETDVKSRNDEQGRIDPKRVADYFWPLILSSFVFLMHASYLSTVAWDQLVKHPLERFNFYEASILLVLCLTYFIPVLFIYYPHYALPVYGLFTNETRDIYDFEVEGLVSSAKIVTTLMFGVIYIGWAAFDFYELRHIQKHAGHSELPNKMAPFEKALWMTIDTFLGVTLLLALVLYSVFGIGDLYKIDIGGHFTIKEIAVTLAVLSRVTSPHLVRLIVEADEAIKHRGWQKSLHRNNNRTVRKQQSSNDGCEDFGIEPKSIHPTVNKFDLNTTLPLDQYCDIIVEVPAGEDREDVVPEIKCMVINCGTGNRIAQLLTMIKVRREGEDEYEQEKYKVRLFAYHHDMIARDDFLIGEWLSHCDHPENFSEDMDFTTKIPEAQIWAADADVIIILHSTYEQGEADRVEAVLDLVNKNTQKNDEIAPEQRKKSQVVLVRGFADHSLLASVCYQHPDVLSSKTPHYHRWNHGFLREMAAGHDWFIVTPPQWGGDEPKQVAEPKNPPVPDAEEGFYPIKVIKQNLMLKGSSLDDAVSYLALQISGKASDGLHEQLAAIASSTPVKYMPYNHYANADDFVYCFITSSGQDQFDENRVELKYSHAKPSLKRSTFGEIKKLGNLDDLSPPPESAVKEDEKPRDLLGGAAEEA